MAGLGMPPEAAMPGPAPQAAMPAAPAPAMPPAEAGSDVTMGSEAATPQEQEIYDQFVGMALLALYDAKMTPKTLAFLKAPKGKPVQKVADVASNITMRVIASAKEGGKTIPIEVIFNAMVEIVEAVCELAEQKAGLQLDEKMMGAAFERTLDSVGRQLEKSGDYPDAMKTQDAAAIQSMAASGELDGMAGAGGQQAPAPGLGAAPPVQPNVPMGV